MPTIVHSWSTTPGAGDCGAASLAALRALMRDPECAELARSAALGPASCVLIVSTEGATDPGSYADTVGLA